MDRAGENGPAAMAGAAGRGRSATEFSLQGARLRFYRVFLYLAIATLIAGGSGSPRTLLSTAGLYLVLALAGAALSVRPGHIGPVPLWSFALCIEVGAHILVIARMGEPGSPFLLLPALPILLWGILRGLSGGIPASILALLGEALLRGAGPSAWPGRSPMSGEAPTALLFHAAAFLLLGAFSGMLGRRIRQEEAEHQETRRELEQAQLDAESIVAHLSRGLVCLDRRGRVSRMNGRAQALLSPWGGIEVGGAVSDVPPSSPLYPLARHLSERLDSCGEESHEIHLGPPAGADAPGFPCEISTTPILDGQGERHGIMVLLNDLTELRAREAHRRHKERLALIGELSAGLAHEIRNSLKPITGSVELLRRETPAGDEARDALMEIILREAESLENFLTEFLNFARDKNLQMQLLPLEMVLGEELESLNALPQSPFRLVSRPGEGKPLRVQADRGALRQVVRNLGINALEAEGAPIEVGWKRDGREAVIFMRDHGPGIEPELRRKVFEPFFTTKPSGTGLGLAIARDLVDRLGGRLTLEPAAGGGTLACIRLPSVENAVEDGVETEGPQEERTQEETRSAEQGSHQDVIMTGPNQARAA